LHEIGATQRKNNEFEACAGYETKWKAEIYKTEVDCLQILQVKENQMLVVQAAES